MNELPTNNQNEPHVPPKYTDWQIGEWKHPVPGHKGLVDVLQKDGSTRRFRVPTIDLVAFAALAHIQDPETTEIDISE